MLREASLKARDVIEVIVDNMLKGLEPMVTKTLAPSIYEVRLHADDLERLSGILCEIEDETRKLLDENLERLNHSPMPRWVPFQRRRQPCESAEGDWFISFQEDPDGTLEPGQVMVVSELAVGTTSQSGGTKTRLISTSNRRGRSTTQRGRMDGEKVYARISYRDDDGVHVYEMTKKQIVVGRGVGDTWTDLRLTTKADVSRQHARIRYEPATGRFLIKDLSTFGTTIDGAKIDSSLEEVNGEIRDIDRWEPLPDRARIGLADIFDLEFERVIEA